MSEAIRTLLVAIDLEHGPDAALRGAIAWAREIGARLIIGNVIDRVPSGLSGIEGMAMEVDPLEIGHMAHDATRESLEEHIAEHDLSGIDYELHVRMGSVVDELVRLADDVDADVIIVGRSSAGAIERVVLGSTAERLMRHAGRIVALVPEGDWHRPSRLVFATDFGVCLEPQRELLGHLPLADGAKVTVLAVSAPPTYLGDVVGDAVVRGDLVRELNRQYEEGAERVAEDLRQMGLTASARATQGHPASEILDVAESFDADAVIIGTRGRTGVSRILVGNTAERVARRFDGLTFVVPAPRED